MDTVLSDVDEMKIELDTFVELASHELRTPLNSIQNWSHALDSCFEQIASTPLAQRALQGIRSGITQQVKLIDRLQEVTAMMNGKLVLEKQAVTLLPLIRAAVVNVRESAASKSLSLLENYALEAQQIDGDTMRIQQIIDHILSNAIKFTDTGGHIEVTATHDGKRACITVCDNGIGISASRLSTVFALEQSQKKLCLGLFIARDLIERHGGSIEIDSAGEARGTSVSVFLPLRS